jgi:hypothetical protein
MRVNDFIRLVEGPAPAPAPLPTKEPATRPKPRPRPSPETEPAPGPDKPSPFHPVRPAVDPAPKNCGVPGVHDFDNHLA